MDLLATENIGVILPGIAFGLLKKHGGDLWMDSEWGRGTLFTIRLPRSGATA